MQEQIGILSLESCVTLLYTLTVHLFYIGPTWGVWDN